MDAASDTPAETRPPTLSHPPDGGVPSFDPNFLNRLTTESTLAELPHWELSLPETAPGHQAAELFQRHPRLPGILIFSRAGYRGMVPRERFYNLLGRQFGVDIFNKRPLRFLMNETGEPGIVLDSATPIQAAAEACLRREVDAMYEPLVVTFPNRNPRLVDFRDLILAQTALFAQAKEAKEQFLATMSHELKTPLTSMLCYAELIQDDPEAAGLVKIPGWAEIIDKRGKDLLRLIDGVLDLSKIDAGRMTLELHPFDLGALIREVQAIIEPLAAQCGNRLRVECPASPGTMHADATKVRQNLLNFLGNACKFTEEGTIILKVDRLGDAFHFEVSDTGIGMTPEQIRKIFQPFVQGDSSTTRRYGGSGLGLAIAHHFCTLMGGSVSVRSTLGEGTTFTMLLPAVVRPVGGEA